MIRLEAVVIHIVRKDLSLMSVSLFEAHCYCLFADVVKVLGFCFEDLAVCK